MIDSYSESFNAQLKDIMITAKFWVHIGLHIANSNADVENIQIIHC